MRQTFTADPIRSQNTNATFGRFFRAFSIGSVNSPSKSGNAGMNASRCGRPAGGSLQGLYGYIATDPAQGPTNRTSDRK